MKVVIVPTPEIGARIVAQRIEGVMHCNPNPVLGLATGSSPIPLYDELVVRKDRINWSKVRTFNLDEYVGLPPQHNQSYRYFMDKHLFDCIPINKDRQTNVPDGMAKDIDAMCLDYERKIASAGGIDLQILGIGSNAHIAFNEPGSAFNSRTRRVALDAATRQANKRFFGDDISNRVPTYAISMGMATIMEAQEIYLLGWGYGKAEMLARAIEGPVSREVPASALQLHTNATFVVDTMGSQKLNYPDRYTTVADY